ncbi:MAG: hypothetical protein AMXMBFR13_17920 [Phycisphaerae bacterium]
MVIHETSVHREANALRVMVDAHHGKVRPVRFVCYAPMAKAVFLAGTFNAWDPDAIPLTQDAIGEWSVTIEMRPGRYEFKFVVDGRWCCESYCPGTGHCCPYECVGNGLGSTNRVVEVE